MRGEEQAATEQAMKKGKQESSPRRQTREKKLQEENYNLWFEARVVKATGRETPENTFEMNESSLRIREFFIFCEI